MFQYFNNLGFNNPYYYNNGVTFIIKQKLTDLLDVYDDVLRIDPAAVIELLNKGFILADRTIIQGIMRTPWLARPNEIFNKWEFGRVPKHDLLDIEEKDIAKTLFKKICSEIQLSIGSKKKIGILLSGGMDSRIVAGALDYLRKTNTLESIQVTALTWGNEGTRDVIYADEIATRLNWNRKHYKVTAKDLLYNITETAIHGCEYSPIHLHAIPQIRDDNNLDIIIAGSYGDSIGRGEYSGKKVELLKPISQGISSIGGLVYQSVFENSIKDIENDIYHYHELFPEEKPYMQNELDYQLHYMRRMLNPCMELLSEKMTFYQVFTHTDVFGYIWSVNPKRRNDCIYKYMLKEFITRLDDIPWSRTGLQYGQGNGIPDKYLKDHHSYVNIIRREIFYELQNLVLSNEIKQLNIFNQRALKTLLKIVKHFPSQDTYYPGIILWLASLAEMVRIYNLQGIDFRRVLKFSPAIQTNSVLIKYLVDQAKSQAAYFLKKLKD